VQIANLSGRLRLRVARADGELLVSTSGLPRRSPTASTAPAHDQLVLLELRRTLDLDDQEPDATYAAAGTYTVSETGDGPRQQDEHEVVSVTVSSSGGGTASA